MGFQVHDVEEPTELKRVRELLQGASAEQRKVLLEVLTTAAREVYAAPPERLNRLRERYGRDTTSFEYFEALADLSLGNEHREPTRAERIARSNHRATVGFRRLLADAGGVYRPDAVAQLRGFARQSVDKAARANRLLWLPKAGQRVYPVWQFTASGEMVPHFVETLQLLNTESQHEKVLFFLTADDQLEGETPIECLRKGRHVQTIQRLARMLHASGGR